MPVVIAVDGAAESNTVTGSSRRPQPVDHELQGFVERLGQQDPGKRDALLFTGKSTLAQSFTSSSRSAYRRGRGRENQCRT